MTTINKEQKTTTGRIFKGTVVSTKMKDTAVVKIERYEKHPKYGKFIRSQKKFKAHDAGNVCKVGDIVEIQECRPISKDKSFIVIK
jgi:small subunit ribosomal protein S17